VMVQYNVLILIDRNIVMMNEVMMMMIVLMILIMLINMVYDEHDDKC
jgi:hypothetical protein